MKLDNYEDINRMSIVNIYLDNLKETIINSIRKNYDGSYLDFEKAYDEIHSVDWNGRLFLIFLAMTVQHYNWDGRFSQSNKRWAKAFWEKKINEKMIISVGEVHPVILDGFITNIRKRMGEYDDNSNI